MELIKQHIKTHLLDFTVNYQSIGFDELFDCLISNNKLEYKSLLQYLYRLIELNTEFQINSNQINSIHFHLETKDNIDVKTLIIEFLWNYYFNKSYALDKKEEVNNELLNKIEMLKKVVDSPLELPSNVSKSQEKKLRRDRIIIKEYLKSYKKLDINSSLVPKLLINLKVIQDKSLSELLEKSPFYLRIQELSVVNSYVLVNLESFNSISKIKLGNIPIFKILENILLFDCEDRVQRFNQFNIQNLENLNQRHGTNFKKFVVITFGKNENSTISIRSKLDSLKDRFKIPLTSAYTILKSEIDFLLKRKEKSSASIEFIGFESSIFWDEFILETQITGLYELRSIKMMNVYSICLNAEIKRYILNDLFSNGDSSELLSNNNSTKQAILELRDDDIDRIKESLSKTLDLIINSDSKSKILESLSNAPTIIFDEAILRNRKLLSKILDCLGLTKSIKLESWSDLLKFDSNYFLILSYRDQGKYPNYYYPNILEIEYNSDITVKAILPNFLFGHHYNWSKYYLLKEYYKLISHRIRENYFEWNILKNTIQTIRPEQKLNIDWNLENEYSNSEHRDTFKIKLKNHRTKTFNSSDLFIISEDSKISRKVVKIDFLMSLEKDGCKVYIQNLDEIQENINIYDKIIDKKQQEEELEVIRKQFYLGDETVGRLWKVLLKNLAEEIGEDELYSELKIYFETKGLKIVSQFHFKNSWINPQSESIAPLSKRVFIELCEYLKIPKIYFVIIQRIRNASKQSSRQSTRQMNQLLKDLFNDGCFDNDKNVRNIINNRLEHYKVNHPLDELGIDEKYLAVNLVTLVELIQPELKLLELETIEKVRNERNY